MADCQGVVVLGFRQLDIYAGSWRPDTPEESSVAGAAAATPWNQVEAGMAAALGLPVFILRDPGVTGGVFDIKEDVVTVVADLGVALERSPARTSLQRWLSELVR